VLKDTQPCSVVRIFHVWSYPSLCETPNSDSERAGKGIPNPLGTADMQNEAYIQRRKWVEDTFFFTLEYTCTFRIKFQNPQLESRTALSATSLSSMDIPLACWIILKVQEMYASVVSTSAYGATTW
jgi:hypothetical protein